MPDQRVIWGKAVAIIVSMCVTQWPALLLNACKEAELCAMSEPKHAAYLLKRIEWP